MLVEWCFIFYKHWVFPLKCCFVVVFLLCFFLLFNQGLAFFWSMQVNSNFLSSFFSLSIFLSKLFLHILSFPTLCSYLQTILFSCLCMFIERVFNICVFKQNNMWFAVSLKDSETWEIQTPEQFCLKFERSQISELVVQ